MRPLLQELDLLDAASERIFRTFEEHEQKRDGSTTSYKKLLRQQ